MKKLTVIQTLPALDAGGVERGTLEIARALVAAGHRSIVISNGGRLVEQLVAEGSEHIQMPVHRKSLKSFFQVRPLRALLNEIKPDIIHARSRIPAWIAYLAWKKMPATTRPHFVTTVHGLYSVSPYSAIMTKGETVIAISEAVLAYIRKNYPSCPKEKIRLIYRGADTSEFPYGFIPDAEWRNTWQQQFPELNGKTVIGLPGRISRIKGHETFIELIARLAPNHPNVHGLIIGGNEAVKEDYAESLRAKVKALGLENRITFTGHRNDMNKVLSQCDLLMAIRTTPEAFGRTTLEPLRLGKPVIGWDEGGVGEMLRKIYPFGAVSAHDNDALFAKVSAWLNQPTQPAQSNDFQLSTMCAQTLDCYQQLVATSN